MNALTVTLITVAIIVLSAFFVAVEFSLVAAKQNRLEEAAARSAAGRAALRNSTELTLLLAGSQLGITLCTLALGAITNPAVHPALLALLGRTGLPPGAAGRPWFVGALPHLGAVQRLQVGWRRDRIEQGGGRFFGQRFSLAGIWP